MHARVHWIWLWSIAARTHCDHISHESSTIFVCIISKFMHNCVRRVRLTMKLEHCSFPHSFTLYRAFSFRQIYTRWKIEKLSLCSIQSRHIWRSLCVCMHANARTAIKCNSSMNANMCVVFEINNICADVHFKLEHYRRHVLCISTDMWPFFLQSIYRQSHIEKADEIIFQKHSLCVQFGSTRLGSNWLRIVVLMHRYK